MGKVTIIVPFYNVEEYIGVCLESLIKQTHANIEILCVDDCSLDGSHAIVYAYAAIDDRIKIIKNINNRGLGGGRNTGIKHASGDYICFVDSDDYVSDRFVELLYKTIRKNNSDVAICYYWKDEEGCIAPYGNNREDDNLVIPINKSNVLEIAKQFNPGCTNRIYRRDLLIKNNITQPERRYYEDVMFWLMVAYHSRKISIISDRLYYYRQRSDSIMNTLSYKHIDDRFEFIRKIDSFVKNNILTTPNVDTSRITNDTLLYILIHLHYGEALIASACVENKESMEEYYANEIIKFSAGCNWPTLPNTYKYYQQNNVLPDK